jgi:hypothetical protein
MASEEDQRDVGFVRSQEIVQMYQLLRISGDVTEADDQFHVGHSERISKVGAVSNDVCHPSNLDVRARLPEVVEEAHHKNIAEIVWEGNTEELVCDFDGLVGVVDIPAEVPRTKKGMK